MFQRRCTLAALLLSALLAGCGGGGGGSNTDSTAGDQVLNLGSLVTRVSGTVQPPVTAGDLGAVVTGIAGGNVTSMVLSNNSTDLAATRIAFVSDRDGQSEIYVMKPDGTGQTRLTNNPHYDAQVSWSPDGSAFAFTSDRNGGNQIFVMNADGTNPVALTSVGNNEGAAWSPDGTMIAFHSSRNGSSNIFVMSATGANQTPLTNTTFNDRNATWSPDGAHLAFESNRSGTYNIWTVDSTGQNLQQLTKTTASEAQPAWSPDGTRIAFISTRNGTKPTVWTMSATGANQMALSDTSSSKSLPCWSPDGSQLAFWSDGSFPGGAIFTMNADGSNVTRVTASGSTDSAPKWSPFIRKRNLLGTGGSLGTGAAGFLFGRTGDIIDSVVTFDSSSRSAARVAAQTGTVTGLPNIVFAVTAPTLTGLAFMNCADTLPRATTVIGTADLATASGAIVDFDANNGKVVSVLPYTSSRAPLEAPKPTKAGDLLTYQGHFLGIWNGQGKNLAPGGASAVVINGRTGAIVSYR